MPTNGNEHETVTEERDLFSDDALTSSGTKSRTPKKKKKSKKGLIIIGVLCVILAVCLGVLYFFMNQSSSKSAALKEEEQTQLDDYTTLIQSTAMPEGWDPAVYASLQQQALNAYDMTQINTITAAENGDEAAKAQVETIETVSAQPLADKYRTLFTNITSYPVYAGQVLVSDPGLIDFVLAAPSNSGSQDVDLDVSLETVPDLKAFDAKWGYEPYGSGIMASDGSAPTAVAEVFSYLTQNPAITPLRVAQWAAQYGYDLTPESENDSMFGGAALTWYVNMNPLMPYQAQIDTALSYGNIVIARVGTEDNSRYIVITGTDEAGNWIVQDPSSSAGPTATAPETIKDQLQSAYAFYG